MIPVSRSTVIVLRQKKRIKMLFDSSLVVVGEWEGVGTKSVGDYVPVGVTLGV